MKIRVSERIYIEDPSEEVKSYCKKELEIANPEYAKKARMGFWLGRTPKTIRLYEEDGDTIILPHGCIDALQRMHLDYEVDIPLPKRAFYFGSIPLYDYQEEAVSLMIKAGYGILQSAAGSGKTQMGLAIAQKQSLKTLWITHTMDLLNQSRERAERYFGSDGIGVISEGKVSIGRVITFATVQTLSKLHLDNYKYTWDCIIVDECHRVAGTPTAVTQFSKVLNSICCRHKYGLSATVHRADGFIKSTLSLLGDVKYVVPDESVADKVMTVTVEFVGTDVKLTEECLGSDGTVQYAKMINYLCESEERNRIILEKLISSHQHSCLILSDRVSHLTTLRESLPGDLREQSAVIDGKMTSKSAKAERAKAIEDMREGKKRYLFATYALAKEGLDIPRLDRLFLTTPQKDYAVIVQSVGRVARTFPGKENPLVYDFVDNYQMSVKSFKKRCTSYRKCGCEIKK